MTKKPSNPMRPHIGRLVGIKDLATGIRLFQIEMTEPGGEAAAGEFKPGQFAFLSAFGAGEAPFGLATGRGPELEFAVSDLGHVTHALHSLEVGDPIGVRGPLGNWFPLGEIKGKNVVILGGGFGGLQAARHLGRASADVTLVDRRNFHVFQPLLYQVATGGLSPAEAVFDRQPGLLGEAAAAGQGITQLQLQ